MDALETILTRRSVRRYTAEQIDDETTQKLLEAAMNAPSAANEQPWEFVVIRDRAMLDAIPTFSPFASMVRGAPLGILVCADTRNVIVPGFWVQDCSAATQNLLLAARAWIGSRMDRRLSDGRARGRICQALPAPRRRDSAGICGGRPSCRRVTHTKQVQQGQGPLKRMVMSR